MHKPNRFIMSLKYIFFCCFFVTSSLSFAQSVFVLKDSSRQLTANQYIEIIEDHRKQLLVEQVVGGNYDELFRNPSQIQAYESDSYWLRFKVRNASSQERFLLSLHFDYSYIYYQGKNGKLQHLQTGRLLPIKDRSLFLGRANVVPIEIGIGKETTIFINVHDEYSVSLNERKIEKPIETIRLLNYEESLQNYQKSRFWGGIYLGILIIMMLYNAVLYIFSKDRSYVYYSLFILAAGLNAATVGGFMLEFVWANYPLADLASNNYFIVGTWAFFLLFTRRFLNLYHISHKAFRFVQYLTYTYVGLLVLLVLGFWNLNLLVFLMIITLITILSITVLTLQQGYQPAYYFLVGNVFFTFGVAFVLMIYADWITPNLWNVHIDQIGTVLQIFLFAVGLAKRVSMQNNELAQDQEVKQALIKAQRKEIEQLISQRTLELTDKNKELEIKQKEISEHNQILEQKTKEILKQKKQTELEQKAAERAYKNLKMLKKVGTRLSSTLDVEEIFQIAYRHTNVLIRDSNFGIGILHEQELRFIGYYKAGRKKIDHAPISLDEKQRLVIWCVLHQQEVFTNNYPLDYEKFTQQNLITDEKNEFIKSLIYLPLLSHDQVIGILMVQSEQTEAYEKIDLEILRNLASYVAIAIANAFAYSEIIDAKNQLSRQKKAIEDAYQNIKILQEVGEKINSTLDLQQIVDIAYQSVNRFMKPSSFGIGLIGSKNINFLVYYKNGQKIDDYSLSLNEKDLLLIWCVDNQKEVFVENYFQDYEKFIGKKPDHKHYKPFSLIYIPMMIQDKIMGVMLAESDEKKAFDEVHFEILRNLASYVAIGIDNANAYTEIKTQNIKIKDSLRYAQAIQATILPDNNRFEKYFADFFVIYKPVDMVSGDFYWLSEIGDHAVVVLADCTGHGVPGAFMSMIGNALLNEIVNQDKLTTPSQILQLLHVGVKRTLKQDSSQNSDGMDAVVLHWQKNKKMTVASAKMSLFYVQQRQVQELRGDRFSLGGNRNIERDFTNHQIQLAENDLIYLSSDGFYDQNNSEKQKFGKLRFMENLREIAEKPFNIQQEILVTILNEHQGQQAQRDDITVLGLKI